MLIRLALLTGAVAAYCLVPVAVAPAASCTQSGSNLTGGSGRDVLCGTGSNDRLDGQGGNDELRGDFGDDILIGGPGNDELIGGTGNDSWSGGAGDDHIDLQDGQLDHLKGSCGTGNDT